MVREVNLSTIKQLLILIVSTVIVIGACFLTYYAKVADIDDAASDGTPRWAVVLKATRTGNKMDVTWEKGKERIEELFRESKVLRREEVQRGGKKDEIYYKRITDPHANWKLVDDVILNWKSGHNAINRDFALFSSYEDLRANNGAWKYCNFDGPSIGAFRDCGPSGPKLNRYFANAVTDDNILESVTFSVLEA
jgi:hypothetical protein